ncbi:MAG: (2Fe-2S)-binding protein [Pseudomonadota bacterium]
MDEADIIEGLKMVCQCRGIRQRRLVEHIAAGHTSLEMLQQLTGAGAGDCGGKRCLPRISALLAAGEATNELT